MKKMRTNKVKSLVILILIVCLFSCKKEHLSTRDYPRLEIIEDITQSESGIKMKGKIITEGNSEIIESGFIWSTTYNPSVRSSRIFLGAQNGIGTFESTATSDLVSGSNYYLKAFVQTKDKIVYSKEIIFLSNFSSPTPIIKSVSPNKAKWGEKIKINGENFSFIFQNIDVHLNNTLASIEQCTDTTVTIITPQKLLSNPVTISLSVYDKTTIAQNVFNYKYPVIQDFSPKQAKTGDTITISGLDFPNKLNHCRVWLNGKLGKLVELTASSLKVTIPPNISSNEISLEVELSGIKKLFEDKIIRITN